MKKTRILSLLLFSIIALSNAQNKTIIDTANNAPIPNVKLFSQEGKILTVGNFNGEVNPSEVNLDERDSVEIYHSGYFSKKTSWESFMANNLHYLDPTPGDHLEEVVLTGKKPRYLVLRGYFVSYQLIDNVPQSFSDGIIEYYINLKREKVVEERVLESRIFKNLSFIKEYRKKRKNTSFNLGTNILPFNMEEELLLSDWKKYDVEANADITRKGEVVGRKSTNRNGTAISVAFYTPEAPKKISLFGMKSVIHHHSISEKFESGTPQVEKIKSLAKYYNSSITQKGSTVNYELVQDFYVMDKEFMSREKFRALESRDLENFSDTVETDFWEDHSFSAVPGYLETMLYKELELTSRNEG